MKIHRLASIFGSSVFASALLVSSTASAQRPPVPPAPTAAQPTPAGAAGSAIATNPSPGPTEAPPEPDLLKKSTGGLTAAAVGQRAAETSFSAKAAAESIRAAAARVDSAFAQFVPRITGTARYTRLSDFKGFVLAPATPPSAANPQGTPEIVLNPILDNYFLQAAITVPISDYFLRINEAYTASTYSVTAARYDVVAAKATSAADGKVAYYNWLAARAAQVVSEATLELQKTLVQDAQNQFTVGNASKSDVLQAQSNVAAAELVVERSKNLVRLTEKQVRVAMHTGDEEALIPGEDFESDLPPFQGNLADLVREGKTARYEVKSIDANAEALAGGARAQRNGQWPALAAFGDVTYANPNQRKFPVTDEWFATWAAGAQLVWSPSDLLTARASASETEAKAAQAIAQKGIVRDGIEMEVTQAYQGVKEAEVATDTTKRQLESAAEAYRVARELFTHGRATATQVREAETTFTRARLDALNARAQARTARVRLEHAVGRDATQFAR